ncbi:MAG: transposase, partial [Myxococcota bacterium]
MILRKAYRFRLFPDAEQCAALAIQFGHARFVYNWALHERQAYYQEHKKTLGYYPLKRLLTQLKKQASTLFLKQADSQVLQAKIKDLNQAYQNFFEGRTGFPQFKSKHDKQSIR